MSNGRGCRDGVGSGESKSTRRRYFGAFRGLGLAWISVRFDWPMIIGLTLYAISASMNFEGKSSLQYNPSDSYNYNNPHLL